MNAHDVDKGGRLLLSPEESQVDPKNIDQIVG